jgi:hypothetical protein
MTNTLQSKMYVNPKNISAAIDICVALVPYTCKKSNIREFSFATTTGNRSGLCKDLSLENNFYLIF